MMSCLDAPLPRMFESFDAIGREDQVQIEGAVSELNEILALPNLLLFPLGEPEIQFQKGANQFAAVRGLLLHIKIDILGGVRIPNRIAPDRPKNRYFTPRSWKTRPSS